MLTYPVVVTRKQGVWFGCKHAIPALRRAGGGSIINTASFVALLGAATPQLACTFAFLVSWVRTLSPVQTLTVRAHAYACTHTDTASKGAVLAMTYVVV